MIVQQRAVFARHFLNGHWSRESLVRDVLTFFCFLVAFGKQVSPNLSESRALDRPHPLGHIQRRADTEEAAASTRSIASRTAAQRFGLRFPAGTISATSFPSFCSTPISRIAFSSA